jgi:hypothetical protein
LPVEKNGFCQFVEHDLNYEKLLSKIEIGSKTKKLWPKNCKKRPKKSGKKGDHMNHYFEIFKNELFTTLITRRVCKEIDWGLLPWVRIRWVYP